MATISITIPDEHLQRVIDAITGHYGYTDTIPDPGDPEGPEIANPETKGEFTKRQVAEFIKNNVISWEAKQASEAARLTAIANAEGIDIT